jgi:hypothetical protein
MTRWPTEDLRSAPRVRTDGTLRAQLSLEAEVLYLSSRGMMVRLSFAPEVGEQHSFTLTLGAASFEAVGVVRNVETIADSGRPACNVGIEFLSLTPSQLHTLDSFVTRKLST